jgi:Domain of unknown function (DUF397)
MMTVPEPDGSVWQKSSYSGTNGGCVEVGWRTSSCRGTNGNCVQDAPEGVLVRDSKNPGGPALALPAPLASVPAHHHPLTGSGGCGRGWSWRSAGCYPGSGARGP